MTRRKGTLSLKADMIERDLYCGLTLAGSIRQQTRTDSWAAFCPEGSALGVFATSDAAGAAVLAAHAARLNAESGE